MIPTAKLRIANIMTPKVQGLAPEEPLSNAFKIMAERRISCLLVMQDRRPLGILTERDMVRLMHNGTPENTPVEAVMSTPVLTVRANLDFRAGYSLLRRRGLRHLVVTDEDNIVVGVTSETDFRNHLGRDVFRKIQNMSATMDRDILSLPPQQTLDQALARMLQEKWDYIIVVEHNKPIGIVTERDIPGLLTKHADPSKITLREVMTSPVISVTTETPVTETIAQMTQRHLRHMVVVSPQGDIAGVISQHRILELLGIEALEDAWLTSEEHYRAVVSTIREVIYQTDDHAQWSFLNPAWEDITGTLVDDALGQPIVRFIDPADHSKYTELFNGLMQEQQPEFKQEIRLIHPDGKIRWVELFARVNRDPDGKPIGTTGTIFNITERKAAEEKLKESAIAAEAANHAKSQFLANMSHELRTPLNGVLGMAELLLMTELDEEQQDFANTICKCADGLLDVISQILEFSNLENGNVVPKNEPFSPAIVTASVFEMFAPEARHLGLTPKISIAPNLPDTVFGNSIGFRQILINLLGNAIKFTAQGSVEIALNHDSEQTSLIVEITDTGIGMSPAVVSQLFQPFSQGDGSATRRFEGTGLGLSICHRLAKLAGGTITVTSAEGQGSNFKLVFPYRTK